MATLEDTAVQIAGIGHVYYAEPGAPEPTAAELAAFDFDDPTTLPGWTWLGDTSSENLIEFGVDGGDSSVLRTWDRLNVRASKEASTTTATINSVNVSKDTIDLAFPGSAKNLTSGAWDLKLDGTVSKALLIVIVDGDLISGFLFRNASISGALPTLALDAFTEFPLTATILAPASGTAVAYYEPAKSAAGATAAPAS